MCKLSIHRPHCGRSYKGVYIHILFASAILLYMKEKRLPNPVCYPGLCYGWNILEICFARCVLWHLSSLEKSSRDPHFHAICSWCSIGALLHVGCLGGFKSVQCIQISTHPKSRSFFVGICPILNPSLPCASWGCQKLSHRMFNVSFSRLWLFRSSVK